MVPLIATRIITEPLGVSPTMPTLMLPEFTGLWIREEEGGLLWGAGYGVEPRKIFLDQDPFDRFDHLPLAGFLETERIGAEARVRDPAAHSVPQPAGRAGRADLHARPARHRLRRARGRGAVGDRRRQRGRHHARPGLRPAARRPRRRRRTSSFADPAEFSTARFAERYSRPEAVSEWAAQPLLRPEEDAPVTVS